MGASHSGAPPDGAVWTRSRTSTASDDTDRQLRALMGESLPTCAVNVRRRVQRRRHYPASADRACPPRARCARQPAELAALEARPSVGRCPPLQTPVPSTDQRSLADSSPAPAAGSGCRGGARRPSNPDATTRCPRLSSPSWRGTPMVRRTPSTRSGYTKFGTLRTSCAVRRSISPRTTSPGPR